MTKKIKIDVSGLYNYSVTLTEPAALTFLKKLKDKHLKIQPHQRTPLQVIIQHLNA